MISIDSGNTIASLTTVVAFDTAISFPFASVILVVGIIGSVSLGQGEINLLKFNNIGFIIGSAEYTKGWRIVRDTAGSC